MKNLTSVFIVFTMLSLSSQLFAQSPKFDIILSENYLTVGPNVIGVSFLLNNSTDESYRDIDFASDLYNWRTDELICNLRAGMIESDPNGNQILEPGEIWQFSMEHNIESAQANAFVLNGAVSFIDHLGNKLISADAEMINTYGVNMDVDIQQDSIAPGGVIDINLITRLLIDEDAAKNPGTTTLILGGVPITIQLPQSRWEARNLIISTSGLNDSIFFDPFDLPDGLEIDILCDQDSLDAGRNTNNVLDECDPIETLRAPCDTIGQDDILCEYPDWVFCYSYTIPTDFEGSEFVIEASDNFLVWKSDESPAGSGNFGPFEDVSDTVETGGSDTDTVIVSNSVIPVELSRFDVRLENDVTKLEWETQSEINNSHFDIERSFDGSNFEKIGEQSGKGTTITKQSYVYFDHSPLLGNNYYRLVQYDYDGRYQVSEIKVLNYEGARLPMTVFPNPSADYIIIEGEGLSDQMYLELYDLAGRRVKELHVEPGEQIDLSALREGQYVVQVFSQASRLIGTSLITKTEY